MISLQMDQTAKSTALLFNWCDIIGFDHSSYLDFEQPIIVSYILDLSSGTNIVFNTDNSYTDIFTPYDMSLSNFINAQSLTITLTDLSNNLIAAPTDQVKIFLNLLNSKVDASSAPFAYLLSSTLEYKWINKWLMNVFIQNNTGKTLKAFVQISTLNDYNSNWEMNIQPGTP
jgi:hypothetical protein